MFLGGIETIWKLFWRAILFKRQPNFKRLPNLLLFYDPWFLCETADVLNSHIHSFTPLLLLYYREAAPGALLFYFILLN